MNIQKISWRNLGPYGNKLQTLELPEGGSLWLITGKNGSGKSFFVNLPKILYYGKLDKFKKDEISNRLNKHGWIEGIVKISPGNYVKIEREFSPGGISVNKGVGTNVNDMDFEDIGKAGIVDYQSYIDAEVTQLPYHIFSNIVSLSVNDFRSFVSMSPGDKRVIIDKLFSMEIINKMNYLVKYDIKDAKLNTEAYTREIFTLKKNIDSALKELTELNNKLKLNTEGKVIKLKEKLTELTPKLEEAYNKRNQYQNKLYEIDNAHKQLIVNRTSLVNEISYLSKKIELYNHDKCPTCETPFNDPRFSLVKGDLEIKHKTLSDKLETFKPLETKMLDAINNVRSAQSTINSYIIKVQSAINSIQSELQILGINKSEESKSINNIISNNNKILHKKTIEKDKLEENSKYLSILEQLYSDAGIKKKILETYIPTLNTEIEYTLNELHFPYKLSFTSDFEPRMEHLGITISVETLSTGEKKRVDLAVLISIIRMLKKKYIGLNIFMLDEILSSIDGDGMYDIIGLLQKTAKELKMNIFIINHSILPIEYFDYKIEITKDAGFSDINIENLENNEKSFM